MFGARTCVEGIENTGMRDILRKYGVYSFQGYYYSKPIVHEELIGKYL
jgi:EAL domain-containing protein (putative c-di-GMP-specific phosphodiesterase class I)